MEPVSRNKGIAPQTAARIDGHVQAGATSRIDGIRPDIAAKVSCAQTAIQLIAKGLGISEKALELDHIGLQVGSEMGAASAELLEEVRLECIALGGTQRGEATAHHGRLIYTIDPGSSLEGIGKIELAGPKPDTEYPFAVMVEHVAFVGGEEIVDKLIAPDAISKGYAVEVSGITWSCPKPPFDFRASGKNQFGFKLSAVIDGKELMIEIRNDRL